MEESDNLHALKLNINALVWTYAPGNTTLERAEKLAVDIFDLFQAVENELSMENIR